MQKFKGIRAFIHQVDLRYHADGTITLRIYFSCKFQRVRIGQISSGWRKGENESIGRSGKLLHQVSDLNLNVCWLSLHWHLCETGQVNQCQINDSFRVDHQIDRCISNTLARTSQFICLRHDFLSNKIEISVDLSLFVTEFGIFVRWRFLAVFVDILNPL